MPHPITPPIAGPTPTPCLSGLSRQGVRRLTAVPCTAVEAWVRVHRARRAIQAWAEQCTAGDCYRAPGHPSVSGPPLHPCSHGGHLEEGAGGGALQGAGGLPGLGAHPGRSAAHPPPLASTPAAASGKRPAQLPRPDARARPSNPHPPTTHPTLKHTHMHHHQRPCPHPPLPLQQRTWASSPATWWPCGRPSAPQAWWCCSLPGAAAPPTPTCRTTSTRTALCTRVRAAAAAAGWGPLCWQAGQALARHRVLRWLSRRGELWTGDWGPGLPRP